MASHPTEAEMIDWFHRRERAINHTRTLADAVNSVTVIDQEMERRIGRQSLLLAQAAFELAIDSGAFNVPREATRRFFAMCEAEGVRIATPAVSEPS